MAKRDPTTLRAIEPKLQISFYYRLHAMRSLYLQEALASTMLKLDVRLVDDEIGRFVDPSAIQAIASRGLRGERVFPLPSVLIANPFLLGYYRLLYGLSQKEAYNKGPFGAFKHLEERGEISPRVADRVVDLCRSLIRTGEHLVRGIDDVSLQALHDLQLLTIGPQLRGSENTRIGEHASAEVFEVIARLSASHVEERTGRFLAIRNSSGRPVLVEAGADPDVRVYEKVSTGVQPLIAIEIKGGRDASNVHNRIGEAEKSHQRARRNGYTECWTILRAHVDESKARAESPTTTQFFRLDHLLSGATDDYRRFRDMLTSRMGIPVAANRGRKRRG